MRDYEAEARKIIADGDGVGHRPSRTHLLVSRTHLLVLVGKLDTEREAALRLAEKVVKLRLLLGQAATCLGYYDSIGGENLALSMKEIGE